MLPYWKKRKNFKLSNFNENWADTHTPPHTNTHTYSQRAYITIRKILAIQQKTIPYFSLSLSFSLYTNPNKVLYHKTFMHLFWRNWNFERNVLRMPRNISLKSASDAETKKLRAQQAQLAKLRESLRLLQDLLLSLIEEVCPQSLILWGLKITTAFNWNVSLLLCACVWVCVCVRVSVCVCVCVCVFWFLMVLTFWCCTRHAAKKLHMTTPLLS